MLFEHRWIFIKITGEKKVYMKKNSEPFNKRSYFENYYVIGMGNDV